MSWFGPYWGAPICHEEKVPVPVGKPCLHCKEKFVDDDRGTYIMTPKGARPMHIECSMRLVLGSVAHQRHMCGCYGGTGEDDRGLTKRQAAQAAMEYWESHKPPIPLSSLS